jgi:hypothetical protein
MMAMGSPSAWADRPSLVRCSPEHHPSAEPLERRVGEPFEFHSALFEGQAVVRVRGISAADDASYFRDRRRKMQCLVQGRFKRRIRCRDVVCGQEFGHSLELPMQLVVRPVLAAIQMMQPAMQVDLFADTPHLLTPLAATAQTLSVVQPGQQSDCGFCAKAPLEAGDTSLGTVGAVVEDPVEDTTLLGGWFSSSERSPQERKDWFNARAAAADLDHEQAEEGEWFEPGVVYTFDFYSHVLDMQTMSAFGFDVVPILNGNPIVCMARLRTASRDGADEAEGQKGPEHLWKFEIWHERMLTKATQYGLAAPDDADVVVDTAAA